MTAEALELEVERARDELDSYRSRRTLYLTCSQTARGKEIRLRWNWDQNCTRNTVEVGTYTRGVPLADLRADVFFVYDQVKGRRHG